MKDWILYLQSGLSVESVARRLPKFFVTNIIFESSKQKPFRLEFVGFWFLSPRHFKYVSSRPLLVGTWETGVTAVFGMLHELNNCMILLPERVARFCVARRTHASRVCTLPVPLVPRAKPYKSTQRNLTARHSSSALICLLSRPLDAGTHACLARLV